MVLALKKAISVLEEQVCLYRTKGGKMKRK